MSGIFLYRDQGNIIMIAQHMHGTLQEKLSNNITQAPTHRIPILLVQLDLQTIQA